jgi:HEPN domain-containing protein
MISRADLINLARGRLKDAQVLLDAGRYDGAIYLGGYVVEVALKNRICKTLRWSGLPQTSGEFQNYQSFKTHKLNVLLRLSGVEAKIRASYVAKWSAVVTWDPEIRYNPIGSTSQTKAESLIEAAKILLKAL